MLSEQNVNRWKLKIYSGKNKIYVKTWIFPFWLSLGRRVGVFPYQALLCVAAWTKVLQGEPCFVHWESNKRHLTQIPVRSLVSRTDRRLSSLMIFWTRLTSSSSRLGRLAYRTFPRHHGTSYATRKLNFLQLLRVDFPLYKL